MPIECVLFDLGKVLIDFDLERALESFAPRSRYKREDLKRILLEDDGKYRFERGEMATGDFHRHLCDVGRLDMQIEEFCRAWSAIFLPGLIVSEDLLARLKRRYPLILVSNTNEAHVDFIQERYNVLNYFDHKVFSHVVRAMKPDPKIFQAAIAAAGFPPESLFFTDDIAENVEGARRLGIQARQFVSEARLIEDLRDHGVEL